MGFPYVKPYAGDTGLITKWLYDNERYQQLFYFRECVDSFNLFSNNVGIYDRLTPSTLTLVPECYWPSTLPLQETTLILWSDLKTTLDRIGTRGDEAWTVEQHQRFIELFQVISERYQLPLINTSHTSIDELMFLISEHLGKKY
jgi:hypothetical protein